MSQMIFQRVEKKYLVSDAQYQALTQTIAQYMVEDKYSDYQINNIYYDTDDYYLIRTSLEKPKYKEKLRLRCYGRPTGDSTCFVELKKKYKGVVYKRRLELPLNLATRWLERDTAVSPDTQIAREIAWFKDLYHLKPKMMLTYHRLAYHGKDDPELRLTFDDEIRWRNWNVDLSIPMDGPSLLAPGQRLMELKTLGAMPLWLAHELERLEIWPVSFSKYGRAYETLMTQETKGAATCA
jgi:SPX domain protein involved in polyphosphate accumulation